MTTYNDTDDYAMNRITARDRRGLDILYDRYGAQIYTLALHITKSPTSAKTIVRRVFAQCWHCPSRFVMHNVAAPLLALAWAWAHAMAETDALLTSPSPRSPAPTLTR